MFDFLKKLLGMGVQPTDNTLTSDMGAASVSDTTPVADNVEETDEQVADAVESAADDLGSDSSDD